MRDTRKPDVAMPVEASPAPGGSGRFWEGKAYQRIKAGGSALSIEEGRRLLIEVERMSVALDACTKASWWSQRDNPDAEEMANRLYRVLAACREVYSARRADEHEIWLVSDSGWKKAQGEAR